MDMFLVSIYLFGSWNFQNNVIKLILGLPDQVHGLLLRAYY